MKKHDYFFNACNAGAYRYREWVLDCFSAGGVITTENEANESDTQYPYQLRLQENGKVEFIDEHGERGTLDDAVQGEALFEFKTVFTLEPNVMPNQTTEVETTYGECYINYLILVYPFGTRVPFTPGKVKPTKVITSLLPKINDDPEGEIPDDGKLYVNHLTTYIEAVMSTLGIVPLAVPSATPYTITTDPKIRERRDELLTKYADRLHDPAVIANIDKELTQMDREWIAKDPDGGFYYKDKSFDVTRKKMHLFHGAESGFSADGSITVIRNSLAEGWDMDKLPAMANSMREGSFSRGAETALGGEAVKFFQRVLQNAAITITDCGTSLGLPTHITKDNVMDYVGLYMKIGDEWKSFDEEGVTQFIGKEMIVRSPLFCKATETDFCKHCMGDKLSLSPNSLASSASQVGSVFLNTFMKRMHGTALKLAHYDYTKSLT